LPITINRSRWGGRKRQLGLYPPSFKTTVYGPFEVVLSPEQPPLPDHDRRFGADGLMAVDLRVLSDAIAHRFFQ
jgi:hypothetical protein